VQPRPNYSLVRPEHVFFLPETRIASIRFIIILLRFNLLVARRRRYNTTKCSPSAINVFIFLVRVNLRSQTVKVFRKYIYKRVSWTHTPLPIQYSILLLLFTSTAAIHRAAEPDVSIRPPRDAVLFTLFKNKICRRDSPSEKESN